MTALITCAILAMITGAWGVWKAVRMGREGRQAWKAFDMVYPARWVVSDVEGNWKIVQTITIPPDGGRPEVQTDVALDDGVIRAWRELNQ